MSLGGVFNRVLRRFGRGDPLYFVQNQIVYYSGKDQADRNLFHMWMGVNVPHLTIIHDVQDDWSGLRLVIGWMKEHGGLRAVHYNRQKKEYVVTFADPDAAFAAKMYFPRVTLYGPRTEAERIAMAETLRKCGIMKVSDIIDHMVLPNLVP